MVASRIAERLPVEYESTITALNSLEFQCLGHRVLLLPLPQEVARSPAEAVRQCIALQHHALLLRTSFWPLPMLCMLSASCQPEGFCAAPPEPGCRQRDPVPRGSHWRSYGSALPGPFCWHGGAMVQPVMEVMLCWDRRPLRLASRLWSSQGRPPRIAGWPGSDGSKFRAATKTTT